MQGSSDLIVRPWAELGRSPTIHLLRGRSGRSRPGFLEILVVQIIRHRLEVLYPTTLAIRAFFLVAIAGLYLETRDRMFILIFGVVALGVALTLTS